MFLNIFVISDVQEPSDRWNGSKVISYDGDGLIK